MEERSFVLLLTFVVTALFDALLQVFHAGHFAWVPRLFGIAKSPWYVSLKEYFKAHTPLAAALIAGSVGLGAQVVILLLKPFPSKGEIVSRNTGVLVPFMGVSLVVSALYGIAMQATGLFPHLDSTYYSIPKCLEANGSRKSLCLHSMYYDAWSGLWVQLVLFGLTAL